MVPSGEYMEPSWSWSSEHQIFDKSNGSIGKIHQFVKPLDHQIHGPSLQVSFAVGNNAELSGSEVWPGLRWSSSKALNYSAMHTLYRFVSLHIAINNPVQNVSSEVEASFGFSRKLNQDKETVSWVAENQGFDHFNLKSEEVQEVGRPRERVKTVKHCNFKILRFGDCKLSCWETSSVLRLLCKLWCLLCWPAEGPCWLTFPVWRVWRAVDGPSFGK